MGKIKLFPTPEYSSKQPSDPVVPLVPCTGIFLGPSKSGKTVTLISLTLEQYRGVFERIYIFSPSIDIDDGWKYIEQHLGVNTEREAVYYTHSISTCTKYALYSTYSTDFARTEYIAHIVHIARSWGRVGVQRVAL